jgi:hypothetical protein
MNWESLFKVSLTALPIGFSLLGVGLYWHENPLPVLAPSLAFWGVTTAFYLFTQAYMPTSRAPFLGAVYTAIFWLVASIAAHNLAVFLRSTSYSGFWSILKNTDFWYSYVSALMGFLLALWQFCKHEPRIVERIQQQVNEQTG